MLKARWIYEQEVAFETGFINVDGSSGIDLYNWNSSSVVNSLQLFFASTIVVAGYLTIFNEVFILDFLHKTIRRLKIGDLSAYLLELLLGDEVVIFTRFLLVALRWPSGITDLFLEDSLVLLEDLLHKSVLANA